jgi:hypothetical protein
MNNRELAFQQDFDYGVSPKKNKNKDPEPPIGL